MKVGMKYIFQEIRFIRSNCSSGSKGTNAIKVHLNLDEAMSQLH